MRRQVLLVDDEADLLQTLMIILGAENLEILPAQSGEEALAIAERRRPEAAIVDLGLPGINGLDLLRELLRVNPAMWVTMLTSERGIEAATLALGYGAKSYMTKPFDAERLRAEVMRAFDPPPKRNDSFPTD